MSIAEFKRSAYELGEWLWGAVQGGFNEKLTVGQIVFDAILSAFPVAGEITAARDVAAQTIRMARQPELREDTGEWLALLLPLLAIVPILGGLLKGIGKLLMRVGKNAAEDREIFQAIVQLCNRLGHGNAVAFIRQLDLTKYQTQLIDGFGRIIQRTDDTLRILGHRLQSVLPDALLQEFEHLRQQLALLKALGERMIPQAVKDLNARLRSIQSQIYEGEWHAVEAGKKNVTREAEARLTEQPYPKPHPRSKGFHQNRYEDYQHVEGWPDLRRHAKYNEDAGNWEGIEAIQAFSGPIKAVTLKGPKTLYRVIKPGKNWKAGAWWTEVLPPNGQAWREGLAVLDDFSINGFFIKYHLPPGRDLKVWKGMAAEQFNSNTGQFLSGGATQFYIEWPADLKKEIEQLPALSTGWGKTTGKYGYEHIRKTINHGKSEKLATHEYASKKTGTQQ